MRVRSLSLEAMEMMVGTGRLSLALGALWVLVDPGAWWACYVVYMGM